MIRDATFKDLEELDVKDIYDGESYMASACMEIVKDNLKALVSDDDKVIALVHWDEHWQGVVTCYALFSNLVYWYPMKVRELKKYIVETMKKNNYHRVQMYVREDYIEGQRFAEFLGFNVEGSLEKFGMDKSNYFIFGKVL